MASMNDMSETMTPFPPQAGQAPLELKENSVLLTLLALANSFRISSERSRYVAGVERRLIPMSFWRMEITGSV